ncbi:MAG TPA: sodium:calcium antiporter [Gemmatales bacterium]|nr:sodium:calcium antiporter [Gemmatales bacterium]HMP60526.1 sodium:calcium antiporter [Gemmatales bacterium]
MTGIWELLAGVVLAGLGGELFVRGVLGLACWLRMPKALAAATLAAFATSSPEVSVAINAALANTPAVALGDALGSNIANVGLILGLVLCIGPLPFNWKAKRREYLIALVVPLLVLAILADGYYARWEAIGSLALFAGWLFLAARHALHERGTTPPKSTARQGLTALAIGLLGLGILAVAGTLIVQGGVKLGEWLNLNPFFVGATVVALGTSTPELATAVIAKLRGHDEVGIGTILGSNIFNCLLIVGITGLLRPFEIKPTAVVGSILFGVATLLCLYPLRSNQIGRSRGPVLLGLYAASVFVAWLFQH